MNFNERASLVRGFLYSGKVAAAVRLAGDDPVLREYVEPAEQRLLVPVARALGRGHRGQAYSLATGDWELLEYLLWKYPISVTYHETCGRCVHTFHDCRGKEVGRVTLGMPDLPRRHKGGMTGVVSVLLPRLWFVDLLAAALEVDYSIIDFYGPGYAADLHKNRSYRTGLLRANQ